ncbi:hypothetical protein D3C72_2280520 [compost metagenome]
MKPDRERQHDRRHRKADDDGGHDQGGGNGIDGARGRFLDAERLVDDRCSAAGDVACRHQNNMHAGIDQRKADDDAQDVAMPQYAPKADEHEEKSCREKYL